MLNTACGQPASSAKMQQRWQCRTAKAAAAQLPPHLLPVAAAAVLWVGQRRMLRQLLLLFRQREGTQRAVCRVANECG